MNILLNLLDIAIKITGIVVIAGVLLNYYRRMQKVTKKENTAKVRPKKVDRKK